MSGEGGAAVGRSTAIVLFTDLVGSTELRSRVGEDAADAIRRRHDRVVMAAIEAHRGRLVKTLGDGAMAMFAGASDAVAAATGIQQGIDRQSRSSTDLLEVRIGISAGDVSFEGGDCFGTPVIEAARLCAAARGGQILTSELVRGLAGMAGGHVFTSCGTLDLKGLPVPVPACEVAWERLRVSPVPLPSLLTGVGRIFVGRDDELGRLVELWKEASAGARHVVFIGGEPGVGKTRLAAEFATRVHEDGAMVLAGRCDEDLGVPYQPFVEALRHFVDHSPELASRLGRFAGELPRLVPDLDQRVAGLPDPLQSDPETERYRLFEAVAGWLAAASMDEPVLLVLDDVQWAAKPTLLLLRHIIQSAESMRLLAVVTYRDTDVSRGHPLAELLADIPRLGTAERLPLSGLDVPGVLAFLEKAAGHDLGAEGDELALTVWEETEGNAFFLAEVVRHLTESRALEQRDGRWVLTRAVDELGIPEGVRDVVSRRLARLPERANRILACAAVIGLEFEPRIVRLAGGFEEDAVLDALEESVAARLIVDVAGPSLRNRFGHALVRATLYDGLTTARRAALHRKVAEAIEGAHAGALDDKLPTLAHHWARASTTPDDATRAVDYARRAGDRALTQLAHDEAAAYYRQALDLLPVAEPPDGAQRTELLICLGEAQRRAGDPSHRETLLAAARLAQERGDSDALIRAALANTRRVLFSRFGSVDQERVAVLEAALAAADAGDLARRARLLSTLGLELLYSDDMNRRFELAEEALIVARQADDPATLAHTLQQAAWATSDPRRRAQLLANTAELVAVAAELADPLVQAQAALIRCRALLEIGDVGEFDQQLATANRLSTDVGEPTLKWLAMIWSAGRALSAGRLAEAERLIFDARDLGRATGQIDAEWMFAAGLTGLRYEQDRLDEVIDLFVEFENSGQYGRSPAGVLAMLYAELDRPDDTRRCLEKMAAPNFGDLAFNNVWLHFMCSAARAAAAVDDAPRCETLATKLEPFADFMGGTGVFWLGSVSHYLGLLAAVLGHFDEAEERFRAAEAFHDRIDAPAWLARTRVEWARLLLGRRAPGDLERARQLLDQALATARTVGLANIERWAAALMA